MWLTHPSCKDVQRAWNIQTTGSRVYQFRNKTFKLKADLVFWNRNSFGKVEKEIYQKQTQLQQIQNSILTTEDVRRKRMLREDPEVLINREEMKWAQKARNNGIVLGDRNTKYLQTVVK